MCNAPPAAIEGRDLGVFRTRLGRETPIERPRAMRGRHRKHSFNFMLVKHFETNIMHFCGSVAHCMGTGHLLTKMFSPSVLWQREEGERGCSAPCAALKKENNEERLFCASNLAWCTGGTVRNVMRCNRMAAVGQMALRRAICAYERKGIIRRVCYNYCMSLEAGMSPNECVGWRQCGQRYPLSALQHMQLFCSTVGMV